MARSDQELCAGVFDLFRFGPAIKGALLDVRCRPSTAASSTAEIVSPVGIHVNKILAALLGYPAGFLIVTMAEHSFTLAAVVAGIMIGRQLMVDCLVKFNAAFFDVLFQKVMNGKKFNALIRIPFLQTKPGRIVGVASFGQDEVFALQFFVVFDYSSDYLFH